MPYVAQEARGGETAGRDTMLIRGYETALGEAYCGDGLLLLRQLPASSAQLVLTSPPFALTRAKAYGNERADAYVEWFLPFARETYRVLSTDGSFVIDLGGSWQPNRPVRNVYQYELLLALLRDGGTSFLLAEEDPFAGSNTTGFAAESLARKWQTAEIERDYVAGSAARFGLDPTSVLECLAVDPVVPSRSVDPAHRMRTSRPRDQNPRLLG